MEPGSTRAAVLALSLFVLSGCATRVTVDDGRPLNAGMVADARALVAGLPGGARVAEGARKPGR